MVNFHQDVIQHERIKELLQLFFLHQFEEVAARCQRAIRNSMDNTPLDYYYLLSACSFALKHRRLFDECKELYGKFVGGNFPIQWEYTNINGYSDVARNVYTPSDVSHNLAQTDLTIFTKESLKQKSLLVLSELNFNINLSHEEKQWIEKLFFSLIRHSKSEYKLPSLHLATGGVESKLINHPDFEVKWLALLLFKITGQEEVYTRFSAQLQNETTLSNWFKSINSCPKQNFTFRPHKWKPFYFNDSKDVLNIAVSYLDVDLIDQIKSAIMSQRSNPEDTLWIAAPRLEMVSFHAYVDFNNWLAEKNIFVEYKSAIMQLFERWCLIGNDLG